MNCYIFSFDVTSLLFLDIYGLAQLKLVPLSLLSVNVTSVLASTDVIKVRQLSRLTPRSPTYMFPGTVHDLLVPWLLPYNRGLKNREFTPQDPCGNEMR